MAGRRKAWAAGILIIVIAFAGFNAWNNAGATDKGLLGDLRSMLEVVALVKTQYVDPVEATELIGAYVKTGDINGMLAQVLEDPYTRFLDARAFREMRIDTQGEFGGIGIMVGIKDGFLTIISPIEGTPGYHAGLRGGDRIMSVDGKSTEHMSSDESVTMIRGVPGTSVTLGIERTVAEETREFFVDVVRDNIQVKSVSKAEIIQPDATMGNKSIGYIRLVTFSERTEPEMDAALRKLEREGAEGLILDLRNNPGGLLHAAIDVANKFIDQGPIMHIVGRDGDSKTVFATQAGTRKPMPMVVLINEFSASASEIVSGALKDTNKAVLVGSRTFGKGLVQTVIPLRDGSALSITTARYQTAGGHFIDKQGIEPNVAVELSESQLEEDISGMRLEGLDLADPQLLEGIRILQGSGTVDLKMAS